MGLKQKYKYAAIVGNPNISINIMRERSLANCCLHLQGCLLDILEIFFILVSPFNNSVAPSTRATDCYLFSYKPLFFFSTACTIASTACFTSIFPRTIWLTQSLKTASTVPHVKFCVTIVTSGSLRTVCK